MDAHADLQRFIVDRRANLEERPQYVSGSITAQHSTAQPHRAAQHSTAHDSAAYVSSLVDHLQSKHCNGLSMVLAPVRQSSHNHVCIANRLHLVHLLKPTHHVCGHEWKTARWWQNSCRNPTNQIKASDLVAVAEAVKEAVQLSQHVHNTLRLNLCQCDKRK